jgi:hypothetical protein
MSMVLPPGGWKWKPFAEKLNGDALCLVYATGSHIVYRFYQANMPARVNMVHGDSIRIWRAEARTERKIKDELFWSMRW